MSTERVKVGDVLWTLGFRLRDGNTPISHTVTKVGRKYAHTESGERIDLESMRSVCDYNPSTVYRSEAEAREVRAHSVARQQLHRLARESDLKRLTSAEISAICDTIKAADSRTEPVGDAP